MSRRPPPDVVLVVGVMAACTAMVVGWFASGAPSAPDDGLQQLDVLSLHERVPGLDAVEGRPTMVVVTRDDCRPDAPRRLHGRFGLVVTGDPVLAERLALAAAVERCSPGYVLLDGDGVVRYRTYDPHWERHEQEQEILLEHLDHHR